MTLVLLCGINLSFASPAFVGKETILDEKLESGKATVGAVLVYFKDKIPYILLAEEVKEGSFSDFGGSAYMNKTYFESTLDFLSKESGSVFNFSSKELEKNAYIVHKVNGIRNIVYSVYPIGQKEFDASKNLKPNTIKSKFLWLPVDDLMNANSTVIKLKDIDGNSQEIKLRQHFFDDCLKNKDFKEIITFLQSNQK